MNNNFLKGRDLNGKPAEGYVIDTVIVPQTVIVGGPLERQGATILAVTAYLIYNDKTSTIHMMSPAGITDIGFHNPEPATEETSTGYLEMQP